VVTVGSGINQRQRQLMQSLISRHQVDIPPQALVNRNEFGGFADTLENRLLHFKEAINADSSIIWAMRGGFGSNMLIVDLDKMPIPPNPKTLVGFSDITSMNIFVYQKWNWRAIHAPVLIHLSEHEFTNDKFATLLDILEGKIDSYDIEDLLPINESARQIKEVTGPLTGGNLTLVEASLGTCWEIETEGKILFVEDINLYPEWIYRSMYHLKESGKLSGIKALVFGRFSKGGQRRNIGHCLLAFANSLNVPVYITNQFGHGNHNMPLIYGAPATIHDHRMTVRVTQATQAK
jgi:muramoyltetrapeptide carboxypeptidase